MILRYCRLFQCPVLHKMPLYWGVWIVSGDVWMGSESVWGCIDTKSVGKNLYRSWQLRYSLFFQCPLIRKDAYVWGVSGWCLWVSDGVWIISGGVWQKSGGVSFQYICIPPLYKLSWICVLGCLKGAWRVSGGVCKVSGGVCKALGWNWNMFGKYQCQINW